MFLSLQQFISLSISELVCLSVCLLVFDGSFRFASVCLCLSFSINACHCLCGDGSRNAQLTSSFSVLVIIWVSSWVGGIESKTRTPFTPATTLVEAVVDIWSSFLYLPLPLSLHLASRLDASHSLAGSICLCRCLLASLSVAVYSVASS